jgi:aspartyl-tRNA(Asn)/glutamyl-tRNA(Gln) amidotransferase subunit A
MSETITELRARLQRRELTHERLVAESLEKAAGEAARHVFTKRYEASAMAAARHADALMAVGVPLSALAGLPVSVKDLFDVAGEPTLAGSVVCAGDPAALQDAAAVARLRASGAAIIGKTNMTEFAFSGVGINPHYGTPRNPADPVEDRIPGGSSSGAAVSVALGTAVAGLGSDTGGSIRIPAALCGLVGYKNTQSRVPRSGAFELSRTLDTVCAMTHSVADCLIVDGVLAGEPLRIRERPLEGVRLALPQTLMFDGIEPAVARAFESALSRLSSAGAKIISIPFAELTQIGQRNAPGGFSAVEAYAVHRRRIDADVSGYDKRVAQRIAIGAGVTAADYIAMHDARREWIGLAEHVLSPFDALVCPTVPIVAPAIEHLMRSDEEFFRANGLLLRNTFAINYLDGCAFSLPCHEQGSLPVGLMLAAPNGEDSRLAAIALAVERALNQRQT